MKLLTESYIREIMEELQREFTDVILIPSKTCVANLLLMVNTDGTKLDKRCVELFHRYVAKLLFMGKSGRPELQTTIPLLTKRF